MGAHSSQARSTGRRHERGRHRATPSRHLEPYSWLGAGAITVTVALGTAFVGGSGIAHADEDAGKPAATASSSASASSAAGDEVHTPKPTGTRVTHRKKTEPDTHTSDGTTTANGATTSKVADSQPDSTKPVGETSPESTSSSETTDAETTTIPAEPKKDEPQTEAASAPEVTAAPEANPSTDTVAADKPDAVDTGAVSTPDTVDSVETSTPFALSGANTSRSRSAITTTQTAAVALAGPTALPNPLGLIGAVIAYDLKGAQDLMNPVIAGALGVWHLQTGINELKTLHLIGGALDIVSGVLALATPILKAVPVPGATLLIPVTAVLGSTTATVNTIGQGLLHW